MPRSRPAPAHDTTHAVGRAATGGPGQGSDTDASSDWLAERAFDSKADHAPVEAGTPIDTDHRPTRADAPRESRRGKHQSG